MPLLAARTSLLIPGGVVTPQILVTERNQRTAGNAGEHIFSCTINAPFMLAKITTRAADVDSVNWNWNGSSGEVMTQAVFATANVNRSYIYRLSNPTQGTQDIRIDLINGTRPVVVEVVGFSGVDLTAPVADTDVAEFSSGASSTTCNLTPAVGGKNQLETVYTSGDSARDALVSGGHTESYDIAAANHRGAHSHQSDVDAAVAPTWTQTGASTMMTMASILLKPAGT